MFIKNLINLVKNHFIEKFHINAFTVKVSTNTDYEIHVKVIHRYTGRFYTATLYYESDTVKAEINLHTNIPFENELLFAETCESCKEILLNAKKDYLQTYAESF